jgi:hypothetical protein
MGGSEQGFGVRPMNRPAKLVKIAIMAFSPIASHVCGKLSHNYCCFHSACAERRSKGREQKEQGRVGNRGSSSTG